MSSFQQPDEVFLRSGEVRRRYANASEMWLHRRLKDDSEFPKPIRIERYRYWRLSDLQAWEAMLSERAKSETVGNHAPIHAPD